MSFKSQQLVVEYTMRMISNIIFIDFEYASLYGHTGWLIQYRDTIALSIYSETRPLEFRIILPASIYFVVGEKVRCVMDDLYDPTNSHWKVRVKCVDIPHIHLVAHNQPFSTLKKCVGPVRREHKSYNNKKSHAYKWSAHNSKGGKRVLKANEMILRIANIHFCKMHVCIVNGRDSTWRACEFVQAIE